MSISNWQAPGCGNIISTPRDLMTWLEALTDGRLLTTDMNAEMHEYIPTGEKDKRYGLGLKCDHGYIGHDGDLPGYRSAAYAKGGNLFVVIMNGDAVRSVHPGFFVVETMGKLLQPDH